MNPFEYMAQTGREAAKKIEVQQKTKSWDMADGIGVRTGGGFGARMSDSRARSVDSEYDKDL